VSIHYMIHANIWLISLLLFPSLISLTLPKIKIT